jgi:hypothetical protein
MRSIKFNTLEEAQAVADRIFTDANADGRFAQGTTAYAIPVQNEETGFWEIPILEGYEDLFTPEEIENALSVVASAEL